MKVNSSVAKLRNIHKDIQGLLDDISIQNNANYLFDPIENLWNTFDKVQLRIDVLYLSNSHSLELLQKLDPNFTDDHLADLKNDGLKEFQFGDITYRVYDVDHFPVKSTKTLPYLLKVIICDPEGFEKEDIQYYSQRFAKESAISFIIAENVEFKRALKSELSKFSWRVLPITEEEPLSTTLEKYLEFRDLINLIAINLGTRKVLNAIDSTIENEYKDLSARKISVQNDHMKLKKMGSQRVGQDLFSSLKNNLQRSFSEFENGVNNRFNELTKNQPGTLYSFIIDQIDGIHNLEEAKISGETRYILPSRTVADLEDKSRKGFHEHLSHDVESLNDYLSITIEEINTVFKENDLSPFNYSVKRLNNGDVDLLLNDQFHFEKQHESKAVKKGFMSFFSAVRQPYMIIIMMVGVIGRMIPSLDLWKQWWFIAIIIGALAGGLYFAIKSAKKKKEETESDELKKISQWLKSEYKRIFSNVEKEWKGKYFQHAKSEFSEILRQLESDLKNYQQTRAESISSETNLTQRKIQTLESFDKKLKESQRTKAKVISDINGLSTELKQTFLKIEL